MQRIKLSLYLRQIIMFNKANNVHSNGDDDHVNARIDANNTSGDSLDPEGISNKNTDNDGACIHSPTILHHQQTAFTITMLQPPLVGKTTTEVMQ